jgi:hypothetical protein
VIALIHKNIGVLEESKKENSNQKIGMLERFRSRLCTGRLVAFWENETELCLHLVDSLITTAQKYPRNGWIRGAKENPEDLLRKIIELEDANSKLKSTLQLTVDAPIVDHIKGLLDKQKVEIVCKCRTSAESAVQEETVHTSLLEIAQYVIPKMAYDPREGVYTQIGHEAVEGIIKNFVRERTGYNLVDVPGSFVNDFIASMDRLGLLTSTVGYQDRKFVIVASPGGELVRNETSAMRKRVAGSSGSFKTRPTTGTVLSDVAKIIARTLTGNSS